MKDNENEYAVTISLTIYVTAESAEKAEEEAQYNWESYDVVDVSVDDVTSVD